MNNNIVDALQLLGLDETATVQELKRRWRFLSSHTHPDRCAMNTPEFERALSRQTLLNNAKDIVLSFIQERDTRAKQFTFDRESDRTDTHPAETKEHVSEENYSQTTESPEQKTVPPPVVTTSWTTKPHPLQECLTLLALFGCMFAGVLAAAAVSTLLPFLVTSAPIILVAVMLITMTGALLKLKEWTERSTNRVS